MRSYVARLDSLFVADLRAVIFDYYETLARLSAEPRERMFDELARKVGLELEPGEAYRHWRELTTKDATLRLGGRTRPPLDGTPPPFVTFRDVWRRRSRELFAHWSVDADPELGYIAYRDAHAYAPLYPEVVSALETLRGRYRLAVLSDADDEFLLPNIERHGLDFETVVTSEELQAYKPHLSLFREALARLGVGPEEAVYVGDSPGRTSRARATPACAQSGSTVTGENGRTTWIPRARRSRRWGNCRAHSMNYEPLVGIDSALLQQGR